MKKKVLLVIMIIWLGLKVTAKTEI